MIELPALGPAGEFRARSRVVVPDVTGAAVAELSLVPRLFVTRAMAALRRASTMSVEARLDALAEAAAFFVSETVAGLSFEEYVRTVSRVSGVPVSVVRGAGSAIVQACEQARFSAFQARPVGAVDDWRDELTRSGNAVWARRGDVFAVHAAGNHPGPHGLWVEALALGYRVAVRPSRREPFTPHRLITVLRAAGFGADQVVLLPTGHDVADDVLRGADLGLVYGGDDVVRKYGSSTRVLPQGPGRSKILVTGDWRDHLDVIADSVSHEGGVACINATSVFVDGDPAPLAEALAERLAALPSLPPADPKAVLPVQPLAAARGIADYLAAQAHGTTPWLADVVDDLGDGSAVLRPAVHELARVDAPQAGVELPFPCVWVAPWARAAGVAPLRDSLVLTALTDDAALVDELLAEPSISNVYVGDHPTYWLRPGVPHDGYLGEFLMRTKTVIRS